MINALSGHPNYEFAVVGICNRLETKGVVTCSFYGQLCPFIYVQSTMQNLTVCVLTIRRRGPRHRSRRVSRDAPPGTAGGVEFNR